MNANKEYSISTFDRLTAEHGSESVPLANSRVAFRHQYKRDVMSGNIERVELTLDSEADTLWDRYVRPERERRAKGKHGFAENIARSLLGSEDPHLDLAVRIGDGTDKVLRYWTTEDWMYSIRVREKDAQDAVDASQEHKNYAMRVVESMRENSAQFTGDLFSSGKRAA